MAAPVCFCTLQSCRASKHQFTEQLDLGVDNSIMMLQRLNHSAKANVISVMLRVFAFAKCAMPIKLHGCSLLSQDPSVLCRRPA